ncbi:MAG: hypothetical protein IT377_33785 [Polyangiaceae bacterium]|nr:hypothetical protein [Polyangiaceae bacterium]
MKDPYRTPPQAELVVTGGPPATLLFVCAGLGFAGLVMVLELGAPTRWLGLPLLAAGLALAAFAHSRRARWVFTLEGKKLRVEHQRAADMDRLGVLDVSDGIRLMVDVEDQGIQIEPRLRLEAGGSELALAPGTRYRDVHAALVEFLLQSEVQVDASKDLPKLLP